MFRGLRSALRNCIYSITAAILHVVVKVFFRLRVVGRENVKRDGSYVIVARHRSYWDIPIMAAAIGASNRIQFISRRGLMKANPVFRLLIRAFSTSIDRDRFGKSDFRRMKETFERERLIGLFPEGTTKQRVDAKTGAVRFAEMAKKEILPMNIRFKGSYPPEYPFRYPKVTVSIGQPFRVEDLDGDGANGGERSDRHRRMSERLMERVDTA